MSETVKKQILVIRDTGLTNMFDVHMVERIAMTWASTSWLYTSRNTARNTHFILTGEV